MGVDQAPEQGSSSAGKATNSFPYARTRSKTASNAAKSTPSKVWESIDDELSILSSPVSEPPKAASRKRKHTSAYKVQNEMQHASETPHSTPKKRKIASPKKIDEEKRLRHFRSHAPGTYLQKLERAQSQRMFVINRTRTSTSETPSETVSMAGTTGNIYDITISHLPTCTCPDNRKGNQCKHIVYVLHNVLKAPEHLQYQLAFLTSELQLIFSQAPLPLADAVTSSPTHGSSSNRKDIAGDCPICFMEFEPGAEEIVWCKAACGNNIHKACFEQWARAQSGSAEGVKCVYCRTAWQRDEADIKGLVAGGKQGREGYVNVAGELGLSGRRDTSTYHRWWVEKMRRRRGWGGEDFEEGDEEGEYGD